MKSFEVAGLKKNFGELEVLAGISADFAPSSVTALAGPSGCGKTTLLNIIAGIIPSDAGSIGAFSSAVFSYSFQGSRLLPWLSARDNLLFALSSLPDRIERQNRAERALAAAGLAGFGESKPSQLSGGMRRRLSLARAFAYPSTVLLLDEAFSAVDLKMRIGLMDLFSYLWREEKRTTVFVTHEIEDALYLADRVLLFSARPANIADSVEVPLPREKRRYADPELAEQRERLYRAILA